MNVTRAALRVKVTGDGKGVAGYAGALLLGELAERVGLTEGLSTAMAHTRQRRSAHDPGVVLAHLAVSLADGGDCLADVAVLRNQPELFGNVASDPTVFRVLDSMQASSGGPPPQIPRLPGQPLSRRQPGPPRDRRVRRGSRPLVPTRLSRRAPRHRGTQDVAVAALAHPRPHRASLPPTHRASPRRLAHRRDTRPRLPTRRAHHLTASPPVAATTAPRPSDRARPNTSTRRVSGFPTRPTTRHDRSPHRNHGPNKPTIPPRAAHDFSSTIGANDLLTELRQSTASHR